MPGVVRPEQQRPREERDEDSAVLPAPVLGQKRAVGDVRRLAPLDQGARWQVGDGDGESWDRRPRTPCAGQPGEPYGCRFSNGRQTVAADCRAGKETSGHSQTASVPVPSGHSSSVGSLATRGSPSPQITDSAQPARYRRAVSPMRRCSRTACNRTAVMTLTYVYADSTAVLGPLATYAEPHCYDLCEVHGERLTAPRGWEIVRLSP